MSTAPNILIVMTDQQRGDVGAPGHPLELPAMRKFASEGVRFNRAYCSSPHCCPSRASFFTSSYPSQHGIWNNVLNARALQTELKPGVSMWSEQLAEAGYAMHYTGKWHVSAVESPRDRGWQELDAISSVPGQKHGKDWKDYRDAPRSNAAEPRKRGQIKRPGWGDIEVFTSDADRVAWTGDPAAVAAATACLESKQDTNEPWCLYVGLNGPHDPYCVDPAILAQVPPEVVRLPDNFDDEMKDKPGIYRRLRQQVFGQLSREEWGEVIRHYWAYCLQIDIWFEQILATLDASGQAENTLVVFCSDHGDYMGDHGLLCKGIPCFEGAYHVPMIVRWPGRIVEPGRSVDGFVNLMDIGPTVLAAAGIENDEKKAGQDLTPWLESTDEVPEWRDALFTQCDGVELYYTQRSVRTEQWKYVYNGFDLDELYDLKTDAGETENLAEKPEMRPVLEEMCQRLWRFAYETGDNFYNQYWTVGLTPFGPALAFEPDVESASSSVRSPRAEKIHYLD